MPDRLPSSAPSPKHRWWHRYRTQYLPGESIISRKFEEKRALTEEEKREVVTSEAREPMPPWSRPFGSMPDPHVYAESIGYAWPAGDVVDRTPRWVEMLRDFGRHFTGRGRELLTLKGLLQQRIYAIRAKQRAFARMRSEYQQAEHIRAWWADYREMIDADLMDDMRGAFPQLSDERLREEIAVWSRRARQVLLARAQREART